MGSADWDNGIAGQKVSNKVSIFLPHHPPLLSLLLKIKNLFKLVKMHQNQNFPGRVSHPSTCSALRCPCRKRTSWAPSWICHCLPSASFAFRENESEIDVAVWKYAFHVTPTPGERYSHRKTQRLFIGDISIMRTMLQAMFLNVTVSNRTDWSKLLSLLVFIQNCVWIICQKLNWGLNCLSFILEIQTNVWAATPRIM